MTMLYRMLIVDDEQFVINGLKNAIDWEKYGIKIVGEAKNGQEALAFICSNSIDILFTDIKMPSMDGIQLIEKVRMIDRSMKIIVLSGYEDFDYARTAIFYKVTDYLLKPVTIDRIKDVIKRLINQCNEEYERKTHDLELEQKLKEAFPLMEERFYSRLLQGVYEEELHSLLDIDLRNRTFRVVIAHIDNIWHEGYEEMSQKERQMLLLRVSDLITRDLGHGHDVVMQPYLSNNIILLFKFLDDHNIDVLTKTFETMQKNIRRREGISISLSYGNCYNQVNDIQYSFNEAIEALKHKLYYGNGSIISYEDIVHNQRSYIDILSGWKRELTDSINLQDAAKAKDILLRMQEILQGNNRYTIYYIRKLSMEIILVLSLTLCDKNEELEKIYYTKNDLLEYIQQLETLDSIFTALIDIYTTVISYMNEKRHNKNRTIINLVVKYINEHIDKEITLEKIAQEVYLTPNYIGHIFKETIGVNFNEYVTQVRIEHARKLLKKPENKVYDVSLMVGYKNPHYFTKLFKKYTGVTPSCYKDW
ncbi:response regulator [Marispirochaeta sp.]|uniref:response regulator n=1 Tax=Marispirochaeta sp. TaxID=2038653 RepID=UPI0029C974AD|nr:response regulator [Marispirochaeta sp.]